MAGDLAISEAATLDFLHVRGERYRAATASLAGREEQMLALGGILRECGQGNGIIAVIRGPVGSGKSSLLQAIARKAAASGAICLGAVGSRSERELPLGILNHGRNRINGLVHLSAATALRTSRKRRQCLRAAVDHCSQWMKLS